MDSSPTVSRRDILKLGATAAVAGAIGTAENFGPNIGHDTGGRIMAAWIDK